MIQELNEGEMIEVDGGVIPILILAAFCTGVEFGVVIGIFDGIAASGNK